MSDRAILLRDEIVPLDPSTVEPIDENGVVKIVVIDEDANSYRVTVEEV